ncbi:MAG: putative methyltransferase CheR with domain [Solirubrobacterales bacterium]|nr:putative methyltransferase CheR with domain [Solirubrobacterales bacterium]
MSEAPLDVLLNHLKRTRGFDFTGYKRSSLERRIAKRMAHVGSSGYIDYVDRLEVDPDEFAALFDTLLINVTGFYRDPQAWDYLAGEIVPKLLADTGEAGSIRVWCAGCATGEETYTLAIVLAEALGERAFGERVKIYATDADEDALMQARAAVYTAKQVEAVPPELLARYFERVDERFAFRKDLRRVVIFGRNDLVQDAPISRIDLLACRNTLMYFNADTQSRVLERFNFALNPWGYLLLGRSEMLITHADLFRPVDLKRRVFSKVVSASLRDRLMNVQRDPGARGSAAQLDPVTAERAFDVAPVAQLVIDADGKLATANDQARALFGIALSDAGRPLKDLEVSYRPVDLRSNLDLAFAERRTVVIPGVNAVMPSGHARDLEVHLTPLVSGDVVLGATVWYQDVTGERRLQDELEISKRELDTAYEELRATVEELETTNEELQSTNEELETMNQELESTNQELGTMNDEMRRRSSDIDEVNAFLETILTSLGVGVVVLDGDQTVRVWNASATELWGLRADEAEGRHFLGLDIGLPLDDAKAALRSVVAGGSERAEVTLDAIDRRGRPIRCHLTVLPLGGDGPGRTGAIVLMDEAGHDRDGVAVVPLDAG